MRWYAECEPELIVAIIIQLQNVKTVDPQIMDTPRSGQLLYTGQTVFPQPFLACIQYISTCEIGTASNLGKTAKPHALQRPVAIQNYLREQTSRSSAQSNTSYVQLDIIAVYQQTCFYQLFHLVYVRFWSSETDYAQHF